MIYSDSNHVEYHRGKSCMIMRVVAWKKFVVEQVMVMSISKPVELFQNVLQSTKIARWSIESWTLTSGLSTFLCSCSFQTIIFTIISMSLIRNNSHIPNKHINTYKSIHDWNILIGWERHSTTRGISNNIRCYRWWTMRSSWKWSFQMNNETHYQ
jgi:hypothetical protein